MAAGRLMALDETGTAEAVREYHAAAGPLITDHGGRIVRTTGDGVLIESRRWSAQFSARPSCKS